MSSASAARCASSRSGRGRRCEGLLAGQRRTSNYAAHRRPKIIRPVRRRGAPQATRTCRAALAPSAAGGMPAGRLAAPCQERKPGITIVRGSSRCARAAASSSSSSGWMASPIWWICERTARTGSSQSERQE